MLATSWNCSNRLTGRKVRILYLEVLMQLLCGRGREDNEAASSPHAAPNLCPQSQQPQVWEGDQAGEKGVSRVSPLH